MLAVGKVEGRPAVVVDPVAHEREVARGPTAHGTAPHRHRSRPVVMDVIVHERHSGGSGFDSDARRLVDVAVRQDDARASGRNANRRPPAFIDVALVDGEVVRTGTHRHKSRRGRVKKRDLDFPELPVGALDGENVSFARRFQERVSREDLNRSVGRPVAAGIADAERSGINAGREDEPVPGSSRQRAS